MPFDRFLIAPFTTGLQTNMRPFLIPEDAFEELRNAYVFRSRVRKRFGSRLLNIDPLLSRLRFTLGTTDDDGAITSGDFPFVAGTVLKVGGLFSIGSALFTVVQTSGSLLSNTSGTGTLNTSTGVYSIQTNPVQANATVYYYQSEPTMGLPNYDANNSKINNQPLYGYDTRFAYKYNPSGGWERSGTSTNPVWHGNNLNFFWSTNWRGANEEDVTLFVSNFNATVPTVNANDDPIWYTSDGTTWNQFYAYFLPGGMDPETGPFVATSLMIVVFKDRLILLNTIETQADGTTNVHYPQRARFSHNGSPFADNAFYEPGQQDSDGNTADGGDFLDAPTEEQIVGSEFIKDRLIVYFERSSWELAYTANPLSPFQWQKLNTELGSESTYSTVPFDKVILTIGNTGVHACNGSNVERIDTKIPDEIFKIKNKTEGVKRVYGIRDYYAEMTYWSFPASNSTTLSAYPNQVLVFNYQNGSWAINDDCITVFGYYEQQQDTTWQQSDFTWEEAEFAWNSGVIQAQFRQVVAGNQQGFTFNIVADMARNCPSMQITNISYGGGGYVTITCIDHTLAVDDFVALENLQGINLPIQTIYQVIQVPSSGAGNTFIIYAPDISGTYLGGGTVARVSNIYIKSKQWNPYLDQGRNVFISKIDFGVQKTSDGEVTVDYFPSATELSMIEEGESTGALLGNNILETSPYDLYPLEKIQTRLWHPVYFQADGECIQIAIYMSYEQITIPDIAWSAFELEGMVLHTRPTSTRLE